MSTQRSGQPEEVIVVLWSEQVLLNTGIAPVFTNLTCCFLLRPSSTTSLTTSADGSENPMSTLPLMGRLLKPH